MLNMQRTLILLLLITIGAGSFIYLKEDSSSSQLNDSRSVLVEVYSLPKCRFCVLAKELLVKAGAQVKVVDLSKQPELRNSMVNRTGGKRGVPQIFIDDQYIGDYNTILALKKEDKLAQLVKCD